MIRGRKIPGKKVPWKKSLKKRPYFRGMPEKSPEGSSTIFKFYRLTPSDDPITPRGPFSRGFFPGDLFSRYYFSEIFFPGEFFSGDFFQNFSGDSFFGIYLKLLNFSRTLQPDITQFARLQIIC